LPIFLENTAKQTGLALSGLTIIGANSGHGKSVFVLNQALYSYHQGNIVSIMSLELGESQLLARLFCQENDYLYSNFLKLPFEKQKELIDDFKNSFDKNRLFINHFRYDVSKIKQAILKDIRRGAKLIVIDYLNLVKLEGSKEEWKMLAGLIKDLHEIATKYGVVILTPTQIDLEEKKDKTIRATTRGTKELEYSASNFFILYSDYEEYKNNMTRLIVQKSRIGRKITCVLETDFAHMKFKDLGIIIEE